MSLEMFEHMHNHEALMSRVANWLVPGGKLFVHIFCHRYLAYPFEVKGELDWMARYFFTGGIMPSDDLLLHFQRELALERRWKVNGEHYRDTLLAWLARMDEHRGEVLDLFRRVYGASEATVWFHRWRIFFLACAGLFGFRKGNEWYVGHYLFSRPDDEGRATR